MEQAYTPVTNPIVTNGASEVGTGKIVNTTKSDSSGYMDDVDVVGGTEVNESEQGVDEIQ